MVNWWGAQKQLYEYMSTGLITANQRFIECWKTNRQT